MLQKDNSGRDFAPATFLFASGGLSAVPMPTAQSVQYQHALCCVPYSPGGEGHPAPGHMASPALLGRGLPHSVRYRAEERL